MTDALFERIQQLPGVCNGCFARYRDHYDIAAVYDMQSGHVYELRNSVEPIVSDDTYTRECADKVPRDLPADGLRTVCGECGGADRRPLPKKLFFQYAENLYERYEEVGANIPRSVFFNELEALKTDPAEQFADDRMYRKATERAVHTAAVRSAAPDAGD